MLLYLRHGDDRDDDVYRHDCRLTDRGKKKASKQAERLIEKYGHPDRVFVSPFKRTLETLAAMSEHFSREVEVHRDPRVAQHLSQKQQGAPSVSPETLAQVAIVEDRDAFRRRVRDHVEDVLRRLQRRASEVIWCITHRAVIEEVADHFGVEISGGLGFLDHVAMLG